MDSVCNSKGSLYTPFSSTSYDTLNEFQCFDFLLSSTSRWSDKSDEGKGTVTWKRFLTTTPGREPEFPKSGVSFFPSVQPALKSLWRVTRKMHLLYDREQNPCVSQSICNRVIWSVAVCKSLFAQLQTSFRNSILLTSVSYLHVVTGFRTCRQFPSVGTSRKDTFTV